MKKLVFLPVLLALSISLFACASAQAPRSSTTGAPPMIGIAPAATLVPKPAAPPRDALNSEAYGKAQGDRADIPNVANADRMIVYNSTVGIEVQDAEKTAGDIAALVAQFNGYISATNMSRGAGGLMSGTITLRVPAQNLDAAQKAIESAGLRVLNRNKNSNDVTDQYTDLNARLTNLEAAEKELRELLTVTREKTGKADDILAVYNQLTQVRGQIEQIKGQMNVLSQTSSMATLTVSLIPREQVQVIEPEGWLPDRVARQALRALVDAVQALATLGIWAFLFLLPLAIVVALPLVLFVLLARQIFKRTRIRTSSAT